VAAAWGGGCDDGAPFWDAALAAGRHRRAFLGVRTAEIEAGPAAWARGNATLAAVMAVAGPRPDLARSETAKAAERRAREGTAPGAALPEREHGGAWVIAALARPLCEASSWLGLRDEAMAMLAGADSIGPAPRDAAAA